MLWVSGCMSLWRSPPPPARPVDVEWSAYSGTVLGAAATQPAGASPRALVTTTVLAMKASPGLVFEPLSATGRLFAD